MLLQSYASQSQQTAHGNGCWLRLDHVQRRNAVAPHLREAPLFEALRTLET